MTNKDYEEEIKELIADGFIAENGAPLKCYHCHSTNLVRGFSYYDSDIHMTVEYEVKCDDCGNQAGYWAYGGWSL